MENTPVTNLQMCFTQNNEWNTKNIEKDSE